MYTLTKGERQAAPFDIFTSASAAVGVHKHTKLCKKNVLVSHKSAFLKVRQQ